MEESLLLTQLTKTTMKNIQKILAGLGVLALTTGSVIVTPAKAQACDISCQIESSFRALGQSPSGHPLPAHLQTPVAVGQSPSEDHLPSYRRTPKYVEEGGPVTYGKVSFLADYHSEREKCLAEGRCVAGRVQYSPNQKAWMRCKEVYKWQDAHKICGGYPIN
jgi:hypothetical protein